MRKLQEECKNKKNYLYENKDDKTCKDFATSEERCGKQDSERRNQLVSKFCPLQCNPACVITGSPTVTPAVRGDCENEKDYELGGKDCEQLLEKEKCNKKDKSNNFPPF